MRTHLLRTVYPAPAVEAVEPDTGCASNDEDYAPTQAPATSAEQPVLTLVTSAAAKPEDNDDYYLGGYAGI